MNSDAPVPAAFQFTQDVVMIHGIDYSAEVESLGSLRTQIMAQHLREGRRALTILSPNKRGGTTFVAVNLAVSLAQAGIKTLLIDGNMRDPSVQQMILPPEPVPGLKEFLESEVELGEIIQDEILPLLSVIYAGTPTANAQELLARPQLNQLVDLCLREYEVTIVDTPAANSCADAQLLATLLRYALIVVRKDESYVNDVWTLINDLKSNRVEMIGTVLNEH
ncbi:CpsD/CapB family tyrosine-protein kinase [Sphingobium sp. B2]|uniref:CpsD/CapB family tyrosine-protein kinase n=1 Tax=Sphingobium sp. B2 TaxID=2583228 RepID=UPI001643CC3F|nr:CpsD/CapB family tyrosine-protein kinase [Sphingobium sp. B2]